MPRTASQPSLLRIPSTNRTWLVFFTFFYLFAFDGCHGRSLPPLPLLGVKLVRKVHTTELTKVENTPSGDRRSRVVQCEDRGDESVIRSSHSSTRDETEYWKKVQHAYQVPSSGRPREHVDDTEYNTLMDFLEDPVAPPRISNHLLRSTMVSDNNLAHECLSQQSVAPSGSVTLAAVMRKAPPMVDDAAARGGASAAADLFVQARPLVFWENMVCGAVSRSIAQTVMHPANTMKTILQSTRGADRPTIRTLAQPHNFKMLTRGAGANFLLSVPHGAINFSVLELIRFRMSKLVEQTPFLTRNADRLGPGLDFFSSALSTICCSVVSTPQMMITDNIMAGNYANLPDAVVGLAKERGVRGFYTGWWPGLAGKIPSYALTWTFFQQLKRIHAQVLQRDPLDLENSAMGCLASATTVCIMIPMDTIKTRLVTQTSRAVSDPYKGIVDCAVRVLREEGVGAFYRGLVPRLVSVVPMIGIQFGVYEFAKKIMLERTVLPKPQWKETLDMYGLVQSLEEVAMEVAADPDQPFPAPQFRKTYEFLFPKKGKSRKRKQMKRVTMSSDRDRH